MGLHKTTKVGQIITKTGFTMALVYEYVATGRHERYSFSAEWVHSDVAVIAPSMKDLLRLVTRVAQQEVEYVADLGPGTDELPWDR